jgi:hypothetical protein
MLRPAIDGCHSEKVLTTSSVVSSSRHSHRISLANKRAHGTCFHPVSYQENRLFHHMRTKTLLPSPDSASQASYAGARWCLWGRARGDRQDGPRGILREPRHNELVRNPRRYESTHVSYHTLEHMAFAHWLGTWVMMYITNRLVLGSGTGEAFDPQFDTPR